MTDRPTPPPAVYRAVTAGGAHACAIAAADRAIRCWGGNWAGQAAPPDSAFRAISAGEFHTCAIRDDDASVVCWGYAHNRRTQRPGPFRAVSAGGFHTCAIRDDDASVVCWGENRHRYSIPNRPRDTDIAGQSDPPPGRFVAIAAGEAHTCALTSEHRRAVCWGSNESPRLERAGQSDPPPGAFIALAAGGYYTCGVRSRNQVTCWGDQTLPDSGVGDGPTPPPPPPH